MSYDYGSHKIAAVLSSDIDPSTALRVLGHLATALGGHSKGELLGRERLLDARSVPHLGIARYPLIVLKGKASALAAAASTAREDHSILMVDFPREMLETAHDDELAEALGRSIEVDYLGIILYGPSLRVSLITKKFSLWR
jgi:hypothetical protein